MILTTLMLDLQLGVKKMREPIEIPEELQHYFAYNIPLQVWPIFCHCWGPYEHPSRHVSRLHAEPDQVKKLVIQPPNMIWFMLMTIF